MSLLYKIVILVFIFGAIFLGVRRIWRDWTGQAKAVDKARRARDLEERARPDVVTLERDKDGTYRPPGDRR